ncbi:MAG: sugar ABC transporter substrate-binding protein [Eubacteriales bacterium]
MTKRFLIIALCSVFFLTAFAACGKSSKDAPSPTPTANLNVSEAPVDTRPLIGVSLAEESSFNQVFASTFEALFEDSDYQVKVFYADGDYSKQVSDLADMMNEDIKILVVDPTDLDNLEYILSEYEVAGIPVINLTESINAYTKMLIGPFYRNMGREIGDYTFKILANATDYRYSTNTVFLRGSVDSSQMQGIYDGFLEAVADSRYNELVEVPACNYDYDKAKDKMTEILGEYESIHCVFAETGEMALAAIAAIDEAGESGIFITTTGADKEVLEQVEAGRIDATIFYAPDDMAKVTATYVNRILNEGANTLLPQFVELNYEIITKKNVDNYLTGDTIYAKATKSTEIPEDPSPTASPAPSKTDSEE